MQEKKILKIRSKNEKTWGQISAELLEKNPSRHNTPEDQANSMLEKYMPNVNISTQKVDNTLEITITNTNAGNLEDYVADVDISALNPTTSSFSTGLTSNEYLISGKIVKFPSGKIIFQMNNTLNQKIIQSGALSYNVNASNLTSIRFKSDGYIGSGSKIYLQRSF